MGILIRPKLRLKMIAKLCFLSILSIFLSTEARFTGGRDPGDPPPDYPPDYSPGEDYHLSLICQALINPALKPLCDLFGPPQTPQTPPGQPTNDTAPEVQPKSAQIGDDYDIFSEKKDYEVSQDYQLSQENQQGCGIFPCRGPGIPFEKYAQIGEYEVSQDYQGRGDFQQGCDVLPCRDQPPDLPFGSRWWP